MLPLSTWQRLLTALPQRWPDSFFANVALFWRQIGHRPKLNVHTVWPEIQQLVPNHKPAVWAPLTRAHLKAAAYDSRNRAAGPDGWTPRELNLFNTDMWKAVADFYSHCLVVGIVPEIWKCFRQVQLGKGDIAPTAEFVYAKQLRPICVSIVLFGEYVRKHSLTTRMPKFGFAVFSLPVSMVESRAGVLMMRSLPFCSKPTKTGLLEV